MRILITTDVFPPVCGGSGWSVYELARGLRDRRHDVRILCPVVGGNPRPVESFDGFFPLPFHQWAPNVPYARNYFKNERLYARLARELKSLIQNEAIDIVHAQHRLTSPPSISAANAAGVPVVCTVRDYWPVCYWSDLILDPSADDLCPSCTVSMMTRCVRPRAGAVWPLSLPMIPYMRGNLARKRRVLSNATTVIAVSSAIANDLRARAREVSEAAIVTIPNPVDVNLVRRVAASRPAPLHGNYGLFVGKLEMNKGVSKLIAALNRAEFDWPFVVVGDGKERFRLEEEARQSGLDVRFVGWCPRDEVLAWMLHAMLLVFPSRGPESLSRVLLEAGALGTPVAAMDTGGTSDIVIQEQTGLLAPTVDRLGADVARLCADASLRQRLSSAARKHIDDVFSSGVVVAQIEALYEQLLNDGSPTVS